MNLTKLSLIFWSLFLISFGSAAQETVISTSGQATGPEGKASYIVGQVMYTTISNPNGSVSQGIAQPYEIFTVTTLEEGELITLSPQVHPNPTSGLLLLRVAPKMEIGMQAELYDIQGVLISRQKITEAETTMVLSAYPVGTYFLQVLDDTKQLITFKIIKNQ